MSKAPQTYIHYHPAIGETVGLRIGRGVTQFTVESGPVNGKYHGTKAPIGKEPYADEAAATAIVGPWSDDPAERQDASLAYDAAKRAFNAAR